MFQTTVEYFLSINISIYKTVLECGLYFLYFKTEKNTGTQRGKATYPRSCSFAIKTLKGLDRAHPTGEGHLLYESSNSKTNLYQKHIDTLRNNFNYIYEHLLAQVI